MAAATGAVAAWRRSMAPMGVSTWLSHPDDTAGQSPGPPIRRAKRTPPWVLTRPRDH